MFKQSVKIVLAGLMSLQITAYAASDYNAEEAMWRYTEIGFLSLDGLLKPNYCGKVVDRYLGCIAALEVIAKVADTQNTVVVNQDHLVIQKDPTYKEAETPSEVKKSLENEKIRFKKFETTFNQENVEKIEKIYVELKSQIKKIEPYQIARALNASENMIYDVHTRYRPADRYNGSRLSAKNAILGLNFVREEKNLIVNLSVTGLPAEKAGIKVGDALKKINNLNAADLTDDDVTELLNRKVGDSIELSLSRFNQDYSVKLQFVKVEVPTTVQRSISYGSKKYSYLQFSDFMSSDLCDQVKDYLIESQKNSAGLIVDLRGNGGGRSDYLSCVLGHLIGKNQVVMYEKSIYDDQLLTVKTTTDQLFTKPLVVLVNHESASAAELLAGSVQVYGRGLVIGTKTFGKGTEQSQSEIDRLLRLETSFVYHFANGQSPQLVGVTPQVPSYLNPQALDFENSALREADLGLKIYKASALKIENFKHKPLNAPIQCIRSRNIESQYQKTDLIDWKKDLQLLNGLAALSCL